MKILTPSATNRLIYVMVGTLCGIAIYSLFYYPVLVFPTVFTAFLTVLGQLTGFKSGRSMPEQSSVSTTISKEGSNTEINTPETQK